MSVVLPRITSPMTTKPRPLRSAETRGGHLVARSEFLRPLRSFRILGIIVVALEQWIADAEIRLQRPRALRTETAQSI